jgi:hypothetical protein
LYGSTAISFDKIGAPRARQKAIRVNGSDGAIRGSEKSKQQQRTWIGFGFFHRPAFTSHLEGFVAAKKITIGMWRTSCVPPRAAGTPVLRCRHALLASKHHSHAP